jgi:hypothetical protein
MADTSIFSIEREQHCKTMVYINQLLQIAKHGNRQVVAAQSSSTMIAPS